MKGWLFAYAIGMTLMFVVTMGSNLSYRSKFIEWRDVATEIYWKSCKEVSGSMSTIVYPDGTVENSCYLSKTNEIIKLPRN